jgi:hypothetical protein
VVGLSAEDTESDRCAAVPSTRWLQRTGLSGRAAGGFSFAVVM